MGDTFMRQYEYNSLQIVIAKVGVAKVIDSIAKICREKSSIPALESDAWHSAQSYLTEVANSGAIKTVSPPPLSESEKMKEKHCLSRLFE